MTLIGFTSALLTPQLLGWGAVAEAHTSKFPRLHRAAPADDEAPAALKIPEYKDWGGSREDKKLFKEVMGRLLGTERVRKSVPDLYVWPPRFYIMPDSKTTYNAFVSPYARDKARDKLLVRAVITEGFLTEIARDDADILAAVMGHELGHILKKHLTRRLGNSLDGLVLSREQEIEADLEGVQLAVAANYQYKSGIRLAFRAWKVLGDYSNFEGIKASHPSWTERLEALDKQRANIWKAMAAFQNGYFFLHAEQYRTAEMCFQNVVEEFPDCGEGWANLGAARLMQYCDGLELADLRKYGIGQVVAGCFYRRPQGLVPSRGDNKKWEAAVQALKTALARDPSLVMARANLGLAYLVHPDGEKKNGPALEYFRGALNRKDKGLDGMNLAALLVNFAVAEMAAGHNPAAAEKLRLAKTLLPNGGSPLHRQLDQAILYNEALLAAGSTDKAAKAKAFHDLEQYLLVATPGSNWWTLAYERYADLGKATKSECLPEKELAERSEATLLRVVVSVEVGDGKLVTLSDPTSKALKVLGGAKSVGVPIYHRSRVKRYGEAGRGIDLLADTKVLAIFLTSDKAPPVFVQASGQGAKKQAIRVGMKTRELGAIVGGQSVQKMSIDKADVGFTFLPAVGLGFRVTDDRVSEIVVAQVPQQRGL